MSRAGRAPVFRQPQARNMSGIPGKEQMNAAAARAGDELGNVGASIGENIQKLQWWTMPKVRLLPPAPAFARSCATAAALQPFVPTLGSRWRAIGAPMCCRGPLASAISLAHPPEGASKRAGGARRGAVASDPAPQTHLSSAANNLEAWQALCRPFRL